MNVDYRALLKKYIAHVASCEGTTFIDHWSPPNDDPLTSEEVTELKKLEDELWPREESK